MHIPWLSLTRRHRAVPKVLICAVLGTIFIIVSINVTSDTIIRYFLKPSSDLKQQDDQSCQRTDSDSLLYPRNLSLIDLPSFSYLINNDICKEDVFLIILIHTAPEHFRDRETIRETFGRRHDKKKVVRTVFLLGEVKNRYLQMALEAENFANRDMVQGSFLDMYKNLTYKNVMGLRWASTYCPNAEFILKIDDDTYVNIFRLIQQLDIHFSGFNTSGSRLGNNLACNIVRNMEVIRDPGSKWYVSEDEYPNATYVEYCSGFAYLASPLVARLLSDKANQLHYFFVDDEHVTGTVAKEAGIGRIEINEWYDLQTENLVEWSESAEDLDWRPIFALASDNMELRKLSYQKALRCYAMGCPCCFQKPTAAPKA